MLKIARLLLIGFKRGFYQKVNFATTSSYSTQLLIIITNFSAKKLSVREAELHLLESHPF